MTSNDSTSAYSVGEISDLEESKSQGLPSDLSLRLSSPLPILLPLSPFPTPVWGLME